jgi:ribosome biogenesis GTPase / thiamine phosphate phosphatase
MKLSDFGYNENLEKFRIENNLLSFEVGRVITEHKERYVVWTEKGELEAEITGNMRFTAKSREDFPAVGDWVSLIVYDADSAIIHQVLPRYSILKRQAIGQFGEVQIIATNIDFAFLVQSADRDFNINRLERYLTICNTSGVKPVIVLSKTDLIDELTLNTIIESIKERISKVPVLVISNETRGGYEVVNALIEKGKTYCMLGSSGVGKSSLVNNLSGKTLMRIDEISRSTHKGRHVTTNRELVVLENGGILIDNPGMREVGIADAGSGLEITFDLIFQLSRDCKFKDCTHTNEIGCAVLKAIENGDIDPASYENYQKMEREKTHFESTIVEKRKRDKEFGKIMKNYKKDIRRNEQ